MTHVSHPKMVTHLTHDPRPTDPFPSLIAQCACLLSSFHWYSLRLPTEDGQAELIWVVSCKLRWYTSRQTVTHPSTNRDRRTATTSLLHHHIMLTSKVPHDVSVGQEAPGCRQTGSKVTVAHACLCSAR